MRWFAMAGKCRCIPQACRAKAWRACAFAHGIRLPALHPTIPVQAPLVFDILDLWNGRSIGGCTYHVVHPGGRNYTARPVNAAEAESRRQERFQNFGHTPGPMAPPAEENNSITPMTLDLRWPTPDNRTACASGRCSMISNLLQAPLHDPDSLRRTIRGWRDAAQPLVKIHSFVDRIGCGRIGETAGARRTADSRKRRHVQRLWRSAGREPPLENRFGAAADSGGGMALLWKRELFSGPNC